MSAVKYYDLKQNRQQNYAFSFDKMLDPKGNTGVYLIYQYVRVYSIIAKSQYGSEESLAKLKADGVKFKVTNQGERELALTILRLPESLAAATNELMVNRITDQLYEIATKIGEFYNDKDCKVVGSEQEVSRILLLDAVGKVMKVCFDLLGMKTIKKI